MHSPVISLVKMDNLSPLKLSLNHLGDRANVKLPFFWPRSSSSWRFFLTELFFTSDGLATLALISIILAGFLVLFSDPLQSAKDEKEFERDILWKEHEQRFAKDNGRHNVGALHWEPKTTLENSQNKNGLKENVKIETVNMKLSEKTGEEATITIVGDRTKATISIITHHDILQNHSAGLLPFSFDILLASQELQGADHKSTDQHGSFAPSQRQSLCFYHVTAPGHANDKKVHCDGLKSECTKAKQTTSLLCTTLLAVRLKKVIDKLGIVGRCILLGEGAGANVCLRVAGRVTRRAMYKNSRYNPAKYTISGIVLINCECGGPTLAESIFASIGTLLMKIYGSYSSKSLKFCGVSEALRSDAAYKKYISTLDLTSAIKYIRTYYTIEARRRISKEQMHSMRNVPSLVICAEKSRESFYKSVEVNDLLDESVGSGVVPIRTRASLSNHYLAGGGALLSDQLGRANCVDLLNVFIEAL